MTEEQINTIKKYIEKREIVTDEELKNFIFYSFPSLNKSYYQLYLSQLSKLNIVYRYDSNKIRAVRNKKDFTIERDTDSLTLLNDIDFNSTVICWQVNILSSLTCNQLMKSIHFIEVYSSDINVLFKKIIERGKKVILDKDYDVVSKYYPNENKIYILKSMSVDSPLHKFQISNDDFTTHHNVTTPKLEKILIDLIADKFLNTIFSCEIYNIFKNVLSNYKVNLVTLFRYANKRGVDNKINKLFESIGFNRLTGKFNY